MKFTLESRMHLTATCSQYKIDYEGAVRVTLHGSHSYCYLKTGIKDQKIKQILERVGEDFERENGNVFFNCAHSLIPTEVVEEDNSNKHLVNNILHFVNASINSAPNQLTLDLPDLTKLTIEKSVDRSFTETHKGYTIEVGVTDKFVETATKAGFIFKGYNNAPVEKGRVAVVIHAGQLL